ncbi:hypothetical protein ACVDFE_35030 [Lentzea chajnantorensis]
MKLPMSVGSSVTPLSLALLACTRPIASYSYNPSCRSLLLDVIGHVRTGPSDSSRATRNASDVLPVPGPPVTSNGLRSNSAALTMSISCRSAG